MRPSKVRILDLDDEEISDSLLASDSEESHSSQRSSSQIEEDDDVDVHQEEEENEDENIVTDSATDSDSQHRRKNVDYIGKMKPINIPPIAHHMLVMGPTFSGKTSLVRNILLNFHRNPNCNVIATFWFGQTCSQEEYIKPERRYKKVNMPLLNKLYDNMLLIKKAPGGDKKLCICVLDDIIGDNVHQNNELDSWIARCRHANISLIISLQKFSKISPTLRENMHRVFVVSINQKTLKLLFDLTTGDLGYHQWKDEVKYKLGETIDNSKICTLLDFRPGEEEVTKMRSCLKTPQNLKEENLGW